jgi:uracil-DNA glycosylase
MRDRQDILKQIYKAYAIDPAFARLRNHGAPKRVVPGRGSMHPRLVFVGEAPGRSEATTRKPFMGPAGKVLNGLLGEIGLTRADIFITNAVKYRPTIGTINIRNRTPSPQEIETSRPYLLGELAVFDGVPVVVLGNVPLCALTADIRIKRKISEWHGRGWYDADREYRAMYHPAVAVYDPGMLPVLRADMSTVAELLD